LDLKDKNKRMKAKLIEERQKAEEEKNKLRKDITNLKTLSNDAKENLEGKINFLKQEIDNMRVDHENKVKQLLSDHSVRVNELNTQFSLDSNNLKNKHALALESQQKDLARECAAKVTILEQQLSELKSKLESQQLLLKTD